MDRERERSILDSFQGVCQTQLYPPLIQLYEVHINRGLKPDEAWHRTMNQVLGEIQRAVVEVGGRTAERLGVVRYVERKPPEPFIVRLNETSMLPELNTFDSGQGK